MVRVLLDTNVLSELRRSEVDLRVLAYVNSLDPQLSFVSAISIGEITKGIHLLEQGRKRRELETWLKGLEASYGNQILPADQEVTKVWGKLAAIARLRGVNMVAEDGIIAATAIHHGLRLITRNTKDFTSTGVDCFDPWAV